MTQAESEQTQLSQIQKVFKHQADVHFNKNDDAIEERNIIYNS